MGIETKKVYISLAPNGAVMDIIEGWDTVMAKIRHDMIPATLTFESQGKMIHSEDLKKGLIAEFGNWHDAEVSQAILRSIDKVVRTL